MPRNKDLRIKRFSHGAEKLSNELLNALIYVTRKSNTTTPSNRKRRKSSHSTYYDLLYCLVTSRNIFMTSSRDGRGGVLKSIQSKTELTLN